MPGKYKAYPEYKDSGIEWIGKIPCDWDMWKITHACPYIASGTTPKTDLNNYYTGKNLWVTTGELREGVIVDTSKKITDKALVDMPALRLHPRGSVAIAMYGATIGRLGIFGKDATTNQACCVMPPSTIIHNKFLFYWLYATRQEIINLSSGGGQPNVNQEKIASLKVSAPDYRLQAKIANFLDHETTKIDTLIEKQQQLIQLLKEKRQAVISHAVCVHENEIAVKISHLIDLLPGYAFPSSGFQGETDQNIKLLRGVNVSVGSLRWDDVVYWPAKYLSDLEQFQLIEKDIVFGMDRPWIKSGTRIAEIKKEDLPCLLLQRVARIRANNGAYQGFIKLCLQSNEFKAYVESDLTGVSVPHISPDQIKCFLVRHLSYAQQKSITDNAELKLEQLNLIVDRASYSIELMQERRTALISAAVTGKIDVRDWGAQKSSQTNKEVAA